MDTDEQSPLESTPASRPKSRSDHLMKRVSRACLHCRQRKSKCDLDSSGSPGVPPCQRCIRDGRECVLGSSNRGGRRIRKNKMKNFTPDTSLTARRDSMLETTSPTNSDNRQSTNGSYPGPVVFVPPNPPTTASVSVDDEDTASIGSVPRNPSDAWQCLTGIAKRGADDPSPEAVADPLRTGSSGFTSYNVLQDGGVSNFQPTSGIRAYRLVQTRSLDPGTVWQLVARYAENFHPFLPLVPRKYFHRSALDAFASNEKHLLTAVLTIASKDLVERPEIHEYCSKYMHELISGIAAGIDCDVEAVEALLLLAEWEPQGLRPRIERVGRGEEDRAAWMHVGLALRSGYFLGLDRTSFRGDSGDTETEARRRLAWTSCYISDRLISVRIGRAFWSRGPGPMTGLVSQDFPSLQPMKDGDEDYARIFQATLDLTQLYGNVHDVLYSGMRTSNQMMLMGDYVKYVDDFRLAILRWKSLWGTLSCSTPIQVTLQLSYEYLRLYTNAFAFQAAISQSLVSKTKNDDQTQREHLRSAFNNVASMQDARFIYESVDAAKAYLTILVDMVHPEKHLHFMPLRFYLYGIYAAVFLYKARSFGVMPHSEEMNVRDLVTRTTEVLKRASAGPDDIGSRYSRLLELLWQSKSTSITSPAGTHQGSDLRLQSSSLAHRMAEQANYVHFSPANDFSWLDLEAVGDYVSGDQISGNTLAFDAFQNPDPFQDRSQTWQVPWSGDMSSSLLF
ncbi:C6 transcription factor [Aspergillus steynii IBT 23096]|uniref:C6 transcription factor n=1 Tax=Aspergillus steynii IBT 23096 TaxID=1392250 RepID=A0A2I2G654_9EURO|nr:C6 transcription factor [Aspergillus steynii IBT 23096]PLB48333.1 C6 transcription factor [Aspergillus steynii IBT 23096]